MTNRFQEFGNTIYITSALFLIGLGIGIFVDVAAFEGTGTIERRSIGFFFWRNVGVATLMLLGSVTMGIVTASTLLYNGLMFGYAITNTTASVATTVVLLLPHAVIEIPALVLAGAAGLQLPYGIGRYMNEKREALIERSDLTNGFRLYLYACGLLLIAAMIESKITPILASIV